MSSVEADAVIIGTLVLQGRITHLPGILNVLEKRLGVWKAPSNIIRGSETYNFLSKEVEPVDFLEGTVGHVLLAECDKGLPPEAVGLSQVKLDYLTMSTHQVIQRDLQLYSHIALLTSHNVKKALAYLRF